MASHLSPAVSNQKHGAAVPMGTRRRKWIFPLLAILVGLSPFLVLETGLRILDLPEVPPAVDPYVDLHNLTPLLEADPTDAEFVRIADERLHLFRPLRFKAAKSDGVFRVVALGGSTTQGEPYSTETAFPQWMGIALEAASGQEVEVLNLGGLSYASYRVKKILEESLSYSPDLVVIYTGHNEFLERRSYDGYERQSAAALLGSKLTELRTTQVLRKLLGQSNTRQEPLIADPTSLSREVDALLDYNGGLADYHREDDWRAPVTEHFEWNLRQMYQICYSQQIPLVFVGPVCNLKDCPPFKFETAKTFTSKDFSSEDFVRLWEQARTTSDGELAEQLAIVAYEQDPMHPGVNYLLGQLAFSRDDFELARKHLETAKDQDVCPLRAPASIVSVVHRLSEELKVPFLDANDLFESVSRNGIVGKEWLIDHIHPSVEGHQLLGKELAAAVLDAKILTTANTHWTEEVEPEFAEYLTSINEAYFHRGQQRLEGLLLWTQGRSKKVRGPGANNPASN